MPFLAEEESLGTGKSLIRFVLGDQQVDDPFGRSKRSKCKSRLAAGRGRSENGLPVTAFARVGK